MADVYRKIKKKTVCVEEIYDKIDCQPKKNVSPKTIKMCNVTERIIYDKLASMQLMFKAAATADRQQLHKRIYLIAKIYI